MAGGSEGLYAGLTVPMPAAWPVAAWWPAAGGTEGGGGRGGMEPPCCIGAPA